MSSGRAEKLFFLKLPDRFLFSDEVKWIEKHDKGGDIIVLFLRLISIAKNRKGKLIRIIGKNEIPFTLEEIANETYKDESFIEYALEILEEAGLVKKRGKKLFNSESSRIY